MTRRIITKSHDLLRDYDEICKELDLLPNLIKRERLRSITRHLNKRGSLSSIVVIGHNAKGGEVTYRVKFA